jgi:hypothetical protein
MRTASRGRCRQTVDAVQSRTSLLPIAHGRRPPLQHDTEDANWIEGKPRPNNTARWNLLDNVLRPAWPGLYRTRPWRRAGIRDFSPSQRLRSAIILSAFRLIEETARGTALDRPGNPGCRPGLRVRNRTDLVPSATRTRGVSCSYCGDRGCYRCRFGFAAGDCIDDLAGSGDLRSFGAEDAFRATESRKDAASSPPTKGRIGAIEELTNSSVLSQQTVFPAR